MTAQLGRSLVLQVEDSEGSNTFTTVAGLKTTKLTRNNAVVDVTSKDSNAVKELLEGAGLRSVSISAEGVFKDDAAYNTISLAADTDQHLKYRVIVPGDTYDKTITGVFAITSFDESGTHDGEVTFSISLESSGAITRA